MEGEAAEKQLCVITITEPKETPTELQDQLEPLCMVHVKRSFLCYCLFASRSTHLAYMVDCSTGTPDTLQVVKSFQTAKTYPSAGLKNKSELTKMEGIS